LTSSSERSPFLARAGAAVRGFLVRETGGLLALSVAVGLLAAAGAIGLRWGIAGIQRLLFGGVDPAAAAGSLPGWVVILGPVLGGLIVGPLVHFLAGEAKGHGVPEIMRAVQHEGGRIRPRVGLVKAIASALTIGSGGSCGREGPIAQVGASLGSLIGQRLGVRGSRCRVLTAAGAGAGIAATFNAPIAGAFFALEVILGNFAMERFGPIVVASVVATVATRPILGPGALATGASLALANPIELLVFALLGVAAAAVAVGFGRALVHTEELVERVRMPEWLKPAFGGLAVGLIAWAGMPAVLGNGEGFVGQLLKGTVALGVPALLFLLVSKLVATCFTLGSGGSGGVFFPSLFMGAVLGALAGKLAGIVLPVETAPPAAYALVGMAAVASAAAHAPITMGIMVFELTGDYAIVPPLLLAASVAAIVSRGLQRESIYTLRLARRGVALNRGFEAMVMHDLRVSDVMRTHECQVVPPSAPLSEVLQRFLEARAEATYVVDEGRLAGVVLLHDVKSQLREHPSVLGDRLVHARDAIHADVPTLLATDPLTRALEVFQRSDLHELPVVSPAEDGPPRFVGTISEHDVLGAYKREVLRTDVLQARFVSRRQDESDDASVRTDYFELPAGYTLAQLPVPDRCVGRALRDLDVRQSLGLNVLAIKERRPVGFVKVMPDPHRTLRATDLLVVMGPVAGIEKLQASGALTSAAPTPAASSPPPAPGPASTLAPATSPAPARPAALASAPAQGPPQASLTGAP
jgi:CIC family chloride channel protein